MTETIFIGVAWPYANGSLHLGHIAGAYLPADIFARYHRLKGNEVLMVSGSDQHGTPITIRAEQEGSTPQQIVDFYHGSSSSPGGSWASRSTFSPPPAPPTTNRSPRTSSSGSWKRAISTATPSPSFTAPTASASCPTATSKAPAPTAARPAPAATSATPAASRSTPPS